MDLNYFNNSPATPFLSKLVTKTELIFFIQFIVFILIYAGNNSQKKDSLTDICRQQAGIFFIPTFHPMEGAWQ